MSSTDARTWSGEHDPGFASVVAICAVASLLAAGCAAGSGQAIADRIRATNSPMVREVVLSPANFWQGSGDAVYVYLTDAATDEEALDLWCTVVYPPGANTLPAGQVGLYKGGEPQQGGGRSGASLVLRDPVCPEGGSSAPSG
jgi:hypothetical protein